MTKEVLINVATLLLTAWTINSFLNLLIPLQKANLLLKRLSVPIDMHIMIGKNRLLGDSTTVLGFFTAIFAGFLIQMIFPYIPGTLIGLGMYLGHMFGSFIKRRFGVQSGDFFPVLDHGDGIIVTGGILYTLNYITLPVYLISILATLICYPIICYIAYKLKLREKPL